MGTPSDPRCNSLVLSGFRKHGRTGFPGALVIGSLSRNRGFTLVELVVTLVILGILASVGAARFFSTSAFDQQSATQEALAALRYARSVAVSSQCPVQARFQGSSPRIALFYRSDTATPAACGSATPAQYLAPVLKPGTGSAYQSGAGDPVSKVAVANINVVFSAAGTATLSGGSTVQIGSRTIQVDTMTGLVYAN